MDLQKLKRFIDDPTYSDEELVETLKKELSDEGGRITDVELHELGELGAVCGGKRPDAMDKFREWFLETHGRNCPACLKLKEG